MLQERKENPLSIFAGQPVVEKETAMNLLARLAVNFPEMNTTYGDVSFWTVLGEQIMDEQWSEGRLRYAVNVMLKCFKYRKWNVAEFLDIDKNIDTWTAQEAELIPLPHAPLAMAHIGEKWCVCKKSDAERMGIEHRPWETNAEKKARGVL